MMENITIPDEPVHETATKKTTDAELITIAERYRKNHDKYPTVKELTQRANSQYQAEKVLKQLKKQAEEPPQLQLVKGGDDRAIR
jgi:hypothetical protein